MQQASLCYQADNFQAVETLAVRFDHNYPKGLLHLHHSFCTRCLGHKCHFEIASIYAQSRLHTSLELDHLVNHYYLLVE